MAISIMEQNGRVQPYVTTYIADKAADVANLPTDATPGSTCLVADTSDVYILNNDKEWKLL